MHFTYTFPLIYIHRFYVQSLYLHSGSKVTEPEALENKVEGENHTNLKAV